MAGRQEIMANEASRFEVSVKQHERNEAQKRDTVQIFQNETTDACADVRGLANEIMAREQRERVSRLEVAQPTAIAAQVLPSNHRGSKRPKKTGVETSSATQQGSAKEGVDIPLAGHQNPLARCKRQTGTEQLSFAMTTTKANKECFTARRQSMGIGAPSILAALKVTPYVSPGGVVRHTAGHCARAALCRYNRTLGWD